MSTQYPPSTQPGPQQPSPYGGPQAQAPAPQGTDPVAILGLVFAFLFWPLGLVLSIVGIARTGQGKRPGRGLAVAGAIISAIAGVLVVIAFAVLGAFASQASEDLDAAAAQLEEDLAESEASAAAADPAVESEPAAEEEPAAEPAAAVGVGEPATVENVTFTVTGEECGATTIGDEFLSTDAQGEFCLFAVTVQNGSAEPFFFDSSSVYGYLGGAEYGADSEASIYLEDNDAFLEEINPGNTIEATVVFDVPAGARLDRLELAPNMFSSERAVVTLR